MYKLSDLKLVDGLAWIRAHPESFFRSGVPTGIEIACHLLRDAIFTVGECRIVRTEDWWLVCSDKDWLAVESLSMTDLFCKVIPAPEQGDNSMRGEIIVGAFATEVATYDGSTWTLIKGDVPDLVRSAASNLGTDRVIAFRLTV